MEELLALIDGLKAKAEAEIKLAYDKGFADGVASTGSDKIFSQADLDLKIQEAVSPLKSEIEALQLQVVQVDQRVSDAIAAFKVELLAKVKEVDAIEDAALEELLK